MKKLIIMMTIIFSVANFHTAEATTAIGKAPTNISNPVQAKLMARRAAQVIAIKNNGGQVPKIISEDWNPSTGEYTIQY